MTSPLHAKTIPSAFIRLDATMSDADAYNNVHDMQVRLENHNKLLARRIRQPIFTASFHDDTDARDPISFKAGRVYEPSLRLVNEECVFRAPVWLPPAVQTCTLTGWIGLSGSASVPCYAWLSFTNDDLPILGQSAAFTVNAAASRFSGTVKVPPGAPGMAMFTFFADSVVEGSDNKSSVTIRDVGFENGQQFLDIDQASLSDPTGQALYIDSHAELGFRVVTDSYNIGTAALNGSADCWRAYLSQPFDQSILPSYTASLRSRTGVLLHTLSLWPTAISDFDAGVEMP